MKGIREFIHSQRTTEIALHIICDLKNEMLTFLGGNVVRCRTYCQTEDMGKQSRCIKVIIVRISTFKNAKTFVKKPFKKKTGLKRKITWSGKTSSVPYAFQQPAPDMHPEKTPGILLRSVINMWGISGEQDNLILTERKRRIIHKLHISAA